MQLFEKPKTFSEIFIASVEFSLNSKHFERKNGLHSLCSSKVIDFERSAYLNA